MMDNEKKQPSLMELSICVEQTADYVMITDCNGTIEYVNPAFEKATGFRKHEAVGKTPRILNSGKHNKAYYQKLWTTILSGKVFRATTINRKKNGQLYYADQTISPVKEASGKITHFISLWKDITEKALKTLNTQLSFEKFKLEAVLRIEEKLSTLVQLDKLIDFVVEKTTEILEARKCSLMLVDEETGELCIKGCKGIEESYMNLDGFKVGDPIAGQVAKEGVPVLVKNIETDQRFGRKNRPSYQTKSFMSVPMTMEHRLIGVINVADKSSRDGKVFTDLDIRILSMIVRQVAVAIENAKLYRELKYCTITDPLTQIYNFRHLAESLDHEITRAQRYQRELSLIMIDVDDLKHYNDTFGHLEGDLLLKTVSQIFKKDFRNTDIICRYAGDEFIVILPETDYEGARIVGEKIRKIIEAYPFIDLSTLEDKTEEVNTAFSQGKKGHYTAKDTTGKPVVSEAVLARGPKDHGPRASGGPKGRPLTGFPSVFGKEKTSKKQVTISLGIASYIQGMTRHEFMQKVDRALYQAKRDGKNRVCVFGATHPLESAKL